ncbi:hypothetical protein [Tianweitania sediminis]|uniref:Uncharacterized protein n=1 Tax=Tianweitania sediminis TaxID=1502156 RepID=A0A8J7RFN6_9HYPH|nr:hypothetical protein [Tianweitania sediminis]MBP0437591.1 hypothetical protein [Tianweitania sediminis]
MSRAVNVVGNDAWEGTASSEASQEMDYEPRQVREASVAAKPTYRFEREDEPRKPEWASSLLLVQEACEAIKASEERVQVLELEIEAMNAAHRDASIQMAARLNSAEEEIRAANQRAKAFEARAIEAETWLTRLNQAIVNGFGGSIKREKNAQLRAG